MIVRPLEPGEGRIFAAIRCAALRTDPTSFAAHISDYATTTDAEWETLLAVRTAFVAFDGDRPVGLASLIPEHMSRLAHRAAVTNVFVAPEYRGQGVADVLFDALEKDARGRGIVQIELAVNADAPAALRFYARRGYTQIGRIPRGFRHGDRFFDEILLAKALDADRNPA